MSTHALTAELPLLDRAVEAGALHPADRAYVAMLERRFGATDAIGRAVAALALSQVRAGHVCARLDVLAGQPMTGPDASQDEDAAQAVPECWPALDALLAPLRTWDAVTTDESAADAHAFVLVDGTRLYLSRYLRFEQRMTAAIGARLQAPPPSLDVHAVRARLAQLCGDADPNASAQRLAVVAALRSRLAMIVGGPGTGKTTTVLRLLAALVLEAADAGRQIPRVALLAPTGKAGARLGESIREGLDRMRERGDLEPDAFARVEAAVSGGASTVHRALGYQPATPTRFRYGADNPLPADVVVLDEASMVDLGLMVRLVEAVSPEARLILLGDEAQLASVEAGAVLGDVVSAGRALPGYSAAFASDVAAWLPSPPQVEVSPAPPVIRDAVVKLTHSYRFDDGGGIGQLARAIEQGEFARVQAVLAAGDNDVTFVDSSRASTTALAARLGSRYADLLAAEDPTAALAAMRRFQVLCAHRSGPSGIERWNDALERALVSRGLRPHGGGVPYRHRPVLVTTNEPTVGLFNGDVGITLSDDAGFGVWFPSAEGPRRVASGRVPAHETVFAMTVHKSQGSEFDEVVVVLPNQPSAITTRELLYTGVTRAKSRVTIIGSEASLRYAVEHPLQRSSGLRERLWGA